MRRCRSFAVFGWFVGLAMSCVPGVRAAAAPETRVIPGLDLKLVKCPAGLVVIGVPADTPGIEDDESPPTRVNLTHDFWIGTTEVTVAQWRRFTEITGYLTDAESTGAGIFLFRDKDGAPHPGLSWRDPGYPQEENYPVVGISWHDAQQFCRWLTEREQSAGRLPAGYVYTLPTEAQWEYACRAGRTDDPSNGPDYAWYKDNSGGKTHAVALKRPNLWGLYDMHGNVWEWVYDWYGAYPGGEWNDYAGPPSPNDRNIIMPHHELRGGGQSNPAGHGIGSTNRWSTTGNTQDDWAGFRLALAMPPQPAPPAGRAANATKKR
jgi:formylglycine-generating enzyme required for sulfatase activity